MKTNKFLVVALALCFMSVTCVQAQTLKPSIIEKYPATVVAQTYDIVSKIPASEDLQLQIAAKIEEESQLAVAFLKNNEGILTDEAKQNILQFRKQWMKELLKGDLLAQYYRGVYDPECKKKSDAEAARIQANTPKMQNNVRKQLASCLRQIYLENKVIESTQPKKKVEKLQSEVWNKWLLNFEQKTGWRINPDFTAESVWTESRTIPRMSK
ncbi:MAG: hypothetical protein KBS95_05580 [Alistipes sp.]|nr:hypothetical protein [Candidatus Alistipes equi]